jgi:hypothetical protein
VRARLAGARRHPHLPRQVRPVRQQAETREDPAAGRHQQVVLGHRLLLHLDGQRRFVDVDPDRVDRPAQAFDLGLELVGPTRRIEVDGARPRRQPQLGIPQPFGGVPALAPQQLRLLGGGAVDGDDLPRPLGSEQRVQGAADLDQLVAHRPDPPVALVARGDVAGELVEVPLVGHHQAVAARLHHPGQDALERGEVEARFPVVEERADALVEDRRQLACEGCESGAERSRQPLSDHDQFRSHASTSGSIGGGGSAPSIGIGSRKRGVTHGGRKWPRKAGLFSDRRLRNGNCACKSGSEGPGAGRVGTRLVRVASARDSVDPAAIPRLLAGVESPPRAHSRAPPTTLAGPS